MDTERLQDGRGCAPELICTGVVLAGGRSRRMGTDKAALVVAGQPLLAHIVARLRAVLPRVLVVGPEHLSTLVPGVRIVPDRPPFAGPLGGLATALGEIETPYAFVVACDMPFIAPSLVRALIALAVAQPPVDVALPRSPAGLEYLHAVYTTSCAPTVERHLTQNDRSLAHLVRSLTVRVLSIADARLLDPRDLSTYNANTPEDWAHALAVLREDQPMDDPPRAPAPDGDS